jgi:predicted metal-dependent peptidase
MIRSKIIEDNEFPAVAGICIKQGQIHLYLNPDKMKELDVSEKIGVLVHEFLHVLLLHCTKRGAGDLGKRMKENIAMDMSINQLVERTFDLPDFVVGHDKAPCNYPANLTAEQYFELLEDQFSDEDMENEFGGSGLDDHDIWDEGDPLEGRSVIKDMAESYAQTKNGGKTGKTLQAGSGYGDILERLLAIETYDIAWQTQVKRFMHSQIDEKRKFSYKRFSRRYGFPAPGRKYKNKAKIAAVVDTSGSMTNSFLSHIGGQLNLMCKIMQVDVFWVDATVQGEVKKYRPSKEIEFPGRGGTDMQPGFDRALEEHYKGVVCFTDGYLYKAVQSPLPTIWVVVNNPGFTSPFGAVVHVTWKE